MTRITLALAALAVALAGGLYWSITAHAATRAELAEARAFIEGTQDADRAVDDVRRVGACSWLLRTFGGEGCGSTGPDTPVD